MPRKKKEEVVVENAAAVESAPVKKTTRKPRAMKTEAPAAAPAEKPARKPRAPRKKPIVPHFVIQNSADSGITYEAVVEKVQAAIKEAIGAADITSIDIYVKAEECKAYYVVNGEVSGAVELF